MKENKFDFNNKRKQELSLPFHFRSSKSIKSLISIYSDKRAIENVQFSFVSLHCASSSRQQRSRHGRKAGEEEGSSITAQFELDVNLEEVTGWFCALHVYVSVETLGLSLLACISPSPCSCRCY